MQHAERDESERQRARRNFAELLQELRVAQAGVQILFAFLLTLVFSARFEAVDRFGRSVYLVSLITAAFATAMITAPVAYHRALFRRGRKMELVTTAHRMAGGGLFFLAISMISAVLLVTDVLLTRGWALLVTAVVGGWFVLLW